MRPPGGRWLSIRGGTSATGVNEYSNAARADLESKRQGSEPGGHFRVLMHRTKQCCGKRQGPAFAVEEISSGGLQLGEHLRRQPTLKGSVSSARWPSSASRARAGSSASGCSRASTSASSRASPSSVSPAGRLSSASRVRVLRVWLRLGDRDGQSLGPVRSYPGTTRWSGQRRARWFTTALSRFCHGHRPVVSTSSE